MDGQRILPPNKRIVLECHTSCCNLSPYQMLGVSEAFALETGARAFGSIPAIGSKVFVINDLRAITLPVRPPSPKINSRNVIDRPKVFARCCAIRGQPKR